MTPERAVPSGRDESSGIDWPAALARHWRWLGVVAYARLGSWDAAEEVRQEVALAVARGSALPDEPAKVAPWLYQVTVRQSLLFRRKSGRGRAWLQRFAAQTGGEADCQEDADPLAWLLLDERRHLVRQALARLPRRDAEILLLKYTEDWSYRQIADHLGISCRAVEARLVRARRRLRAGLARAQLVELSS
jgi:RNA polymerase sigma-70 factor (ECF subfamily)